MIMANFIATCSANGGILNGSVSIDPATGNASNYQSNGNGVGNVDNNNPTSSNLNFTVQFGTNPRRYPVTAVPDGNGGWRGTGGTNSPEAGIEPWTATGVEPKATSDDPAECAA
jgi:hypothetical protein